MKFKPAFFGLFFPLVLGATESVPAPATSAAAVPPTASPVPAPAMAPAAPVVPLPVVPTLAGQSLSPTSASLLWTGCDLTGQPAAGYTLQLRTPAETEWCVAQTMGAEKTTLQLEGLTPATQYLFRIMATNAAGTSASNVVDLGTPALAPEPAAESVATTAEPPAAQAPVAVSEGGLPGAGLSSSMLLLALPDTDARISTLAIGAQALTGSEVLVPGIVASSSGPRSFSLQVGGAPMAALGNDGGSSRAGQMGAGVNFALLKQVAGPGLSASPGGTAHAWAAYAASIDGLSTGLGVASFESYRPAPFAARREWRVASQGRVGAGNDIFIPVVVTAAVPKGIWVHAWAETVVVAEGQPPVPTQDPQLEVYVQDTVIAQNDNWEEAPDAALLRKTGQQVSRVELQPGRQDAALYLRLPQGVYTLRVTGKAPEAGLVRVEVTTVD